MNNPGQTTETSVKSGALQLDSFPLSSYHPSMTASKKDDANRTSPEDIRVLVVDNDQALAYSMSESLERVGYPCTVATSGPEGVEFITRETFDVIISDLVMSEADGMEVLVRAKRALPDCEVVLVTGHASVPKAVEAMQQGAFNFLEKPISPNRLRAVTERAADAVRLRRQKPRVDSTFGREIRLRGYHLRQRQDEGCD